MGSNLVLNFLKVLSLLGICIFTCSIWCWNFWDRDWHPSSPIRSLHNPLGRMSAWKMKGRVSMMLLKKLWHCSQSERETLPHLAECLKLGFLFQKCLWFIRITVTRLMLYVQTVMIWPSCGFNIQLSCVFSVANTALEAKKTSPQTSHFTPDIWFHFAKDYVLPRDYRHIGCTAVVVAFQSHTLICRV